MRLSVSLAVAVITVVSGQTMVSLQVTGPPQPPSAWRVSLSSSWDVSSGLLGEVSRYLTSFKVLGPFPVHAREQHFLSPSYPLNRTPCSIFSRRNLIVSSPSLG